MFGKLEIHCSICCNIMDFLTGYGKDVSCCSKKCYEEFEWRRSLAILNMPYESKEEFTERNKTIHQPINVSGIFNK